MAYTRGMRRKSLSKKRSYAKSVRTSPCRGKKPYVCTATTGCKYTRGKKRTFCRKSKNTRRMKGGLVMNASSGNPITPALYNSSD